MSDRIRVLVADDHPLYREGVARILAEDGGFDIVGQAADAQGAVDIAARERPDVVLLDMSMTGGDGLTALPVILALEPPPKVAMLTVSESDDDVMRAVRAGASGYILKGVGGLELAAIVRDLAAGRTYVAPLLAMRILSAMQSGDDPKAGPMDELTGREVAILRLVAEGRSNKEIARSLDLQEKTVKHYMTGILQKLHVRNRTEAALVAHQHWTRKGA